MFGVFSFIIIMCSVLHVISMFKFVFKAIEGQTLFFKKSDFSIYMKAKSTNYKPVFIEFKNIISILRYLIFCKNFKLQTY